MKRELQPIFTELRLFKDFAAALRGSPQPSQYLSNSTKITTNTETAMLSNEASFHQNLSIMSRATPQIGDILKMVRTGEG